MKGLASVRPFRFRRVESEAALRNGERPPQSLGDAPDPKNGELLEERQGLLQRLAAAESLLLEEQERNGELTQAMLEIQEEAEQRRRSELAGYAETADALLGQLGVAMSEAEDAVTEAIGAFNELAFRATDLAETATSALNSEGELRLNQTVSLATEAMNHLVGHILARAKDLATAAQNMQGLVAQSNDLAGLIDEIENVAEQTAIVALNATIEAARAGQAGRVFSVVASEVRKLAERSAHTADRTRRLIAGVAEKSQTICREMGDAAGRSRDEARRSQSEVIKLMTDIREADREGHRVVTNLSSASQDVSVQVSRIVTAFQYHDLLRQRLEHVYDPLSHLGACLRGDEAPADAGLSVGVAPTLKVVSYSQDEEDITLF